MLFWEGETWEVFQGEDISRGQQLQIGLTAFQYSFLCVVYKSSFLGHIVCYNYVLTCSTEGVTMDNYPWSRLPLFDW